MATDEQCELLALDVAVADEIRRSRPPLDTMERAADAARGLGEPTRLGLALALREQPELCVCDLAWIAERPQNLVSHHVRALRSAGLVRSRREGKMVMYSLTDHGRALIDAVMVATQEISA